MIQTVEIVNVYTQRVWIESDLFGGRHVMVRHDAEDCEPFCYASFHYDYAYTSNSETIAEAEKLARSLGAVDPIEHRPQTPGPAPTAEEIREQIKWMQGMLDDMEKPE
ncbi:hypothetical protein [Petrachloros mirabilis]